MKNFKSDNNIFYIIAACWFSGIIYMAFEYYYTGGRMGVPLDDTWIHFQFADNFAKGYFFQYNPGEYTAGTTSPLYVIVLGFTSLVIKNFIINSILTSFLFYVLSCIVIYKISLLIFSNAGSSFFKEDATESNTHLISLLVALLTAFTGRIVWAALSGMETTMFMFFCLAGIYFHIKNIISKEYGLTPAVLIAMAAISRPEGYLLIALYTFDLTINLLKDKVLKANLLKLFLAITIIAFITLPYLLFSYKISGHFFPNTFRGQGGGFSFTPHADYLRVAIIYFFRDNLIAGLAYVTSVILYILNIKKHFSELRKLNLIYLWILLLPLAMSVLIPNWRHHVRYLIPLIPFVNLITVYLLLNLLDSKYFKRLKDAVFRKRKVVYLLIIFSIPYYIVFAVALGKNTDNINNQQVKLAEWVSSNVGRNETIALNDIGAITFLNKNRIIDMAGLVTPEVLRYRTYNWDDNLDSLNYLLKKNNVSYIIIYDHWFKEYLDKYGKTLTHINSAVLEENTICGGVEMKVYKTNFQNNFD